MNSKSLARLSGMLRNGHPTKIATTTRPAATAATAATPTGGVTFSGAARFGMPPAPAAPATGTRPDINPAAVKKKRFHVSGSFAAGSAVRPSFPTPGASPVVPLVVPPSVHATLPPTAAATFSSTIANMPPPPGVVFPSAPAVFFPPTTATLPPTTAAFLPPKPAATISPMDVAVSNPTPAATLHPTPAALLPRLGATMPPTAPWSSFPTTPAAVSLPASSTIPPRAPATFLPFGTPPTPAAVVSPGMSSGMAFDPMEVDDIVDSMKPEVEVEFVADRFWEWLVKLHRGKDQKFLFQVHAEFSYRRRCTGSFYRFADAVATHWGTTVPWRTSVPCYDT